TELELGIGGILAVGLFAQQLLQGGDLLDVLLFEPEAHGLLVLGIIACCGAIGNGLLVPGDRRGVVLGHVVTVPGAHHGVVPLGHGQVGIIDGTAECGGGLAVLLLLEERVAHAVAGLLEQCGGIGAPRVAHIIVLRQCPVVIAHGIAGL